MKPLSPLAGVLTAQGIHSPSSQVVLNVPVSIIEHLQVLPFSEEDVRLQQVLVERI